MIVEVRLTEELIPRVVTVEWITAAIGCVIAIQVIDDQAGGGEVGGLPGRESQKQSAKVYPASTLTRIEVYGILWVGQIFRRLFLEICHLWAC